MDEVLSEFNKRLQECADEFGEIDMQDAVRVFDEVMAAYPEFADALRDEFWYNLTGK